MIEELIDGNGAGCEVRSTKNELLLVGRVYQSDGTSIAIIDASGRPVPPIVYNTELKLIVRGLKMRKSTAPLILFGKICGSTRTYWKVDRLNAREIPEQRESFRQQVAVPARILCVNSIYAPNANKRGHRDAFTMCTLIDVSIAGALFNSKERFEKEDWIVLVDVRLIRGERPFLFTGQIKRVDQIGADEFSYGSEFTHLTESERDRLCRSIFDIQREDIHNHRYPE